MTWNTTTGTCKVYIDAVYKGFKTNANLINANLNGLDVVFGGSNTNGQLFNGSGDAAHIFMGELTQEQITDIVNEENAGIDIIS